MNAPVSPTVAAVRPARTPGPEARGSSNAAPFASALDDALSADRHPGATAGSDRGVERRSTRADRAETAADRGSDRAAERAADHAPTDPAAEAPADGATDPAADAVVETTPEETAATGFPGAVWALLRGTAVSAAGQLPGEAEGGTTAAGATVPGLPGLPDCPAADAARPATAAPGGVPAAVALSPEAPLPGAAVPVMATPLAAEAPAPAGSADALAGLGIEVVTVAAAQKTGAPVPSLSTTSSMRTPDAAPVPAAGADGALPALPVMSESATSADSPSAGGGAPRQDVRSPEPPAAGTPIGAAPVASTTAPAAPAVGAATGTAASLPVGSQVARQVAVLSGGPDGSQTMTLVLTPDTLGPVEVSVTLSKGSVDLTLRGAHDMGRAALLDGLPDLRRDLESAGLTCSRLEVDRDTGGSWLDRHSAQQGPQQGFGDRGGQQTPGENRSRPWGGPADTAGSGPTSTPHRSTSSGVDYRV